MWCVPFAVGGITRVPTGGRVVCRFIDAFLTCCRVDGGRGRPGGSLLVRRRGTAGRPTRRTVPAPHESRLFASATKSTGDDAISDRKPVWFFFFFPFRFKTVCPQPVIKNRDRDKSTRTIENVNGPVFKARDYNVQF